MMASVTFRNALNDFLKKSYNSKNVGDLTTNQLSDGFGLFYITQVFSKLNPDIFPSDIEELDEYVCDGAHDQGVDILFSKDSVHYLIQVKYQGKKSQNKAVSDHEVTSFLEIAERLHPVAGKSHKKNARLESLLDDINWRDDAFRYYFLSLGKMSKDIELLEQRGVKNSNLHSDLEDLANRAEFKFLDETSLNEEYRTSLKENGARVDVELFLKQDTNKNAWYKHKNSDGKVSYISTLTAGQIGHIYKQHKDSLFNLNIRNWVGNTSTNKDIESTVTDDTENFFFFNNGISAIASEIVESRDKNKLECKDFSVINGAQTVKSIAKKHKELVGLEQADSIDNLRVMIRVTKADNLNTRSGFIDRITQYNNSQNAVKPSDFRSNDGVQTSLNKYFRQIVFKGKKYHYKNKRQRISPPRNSRVVQLDDFCKAIYTFWYGAVDMHGGIRHLYDTNKEGGYTKLFGDKAGQLPDFLSTEELETFVSVYLICESSQEILKEILRSKKDTLNETEFLEWKRALQGKFMICFVISQLLLALAREKHNDVRSAADDREAITVALKKKKYWQPSDWREEGSDEYNSFKELVESGASILYDLYTTEVNQPNFVHRNFVRDKKMLISIKSKVQVQLVHIRRLSQYLI